MNRPRMWALPSWISLVVTVSAVLSILCSGSARAHEVMPAIADFSVAGNTVTLTVNAPLEGFVAGVDLTTVTDTNASPVAQDYDALRALPVKDMEARFRAFWPAMASRLRLTADSKPVQPELAAVAITDVPGFEAARNATITITAVLPPGAQRVSLGWASEFGTLVVRQQGVAAPYTGLLKAGADTGPIDIGGGGESSGLETFLNYIPVGFDHILPKGLDHILFVVGLFFLSTRLSPLLWQITTFTLAHTVTLALSSLGYLAVPASIVEPLIAASIIFIAVENIWAKGNLSAWRPAVVFGFGLLHGLGFASVLGEFGLPEGAFVPALIGFNIGVELGQLTIVAIAALLCWTWAAKQTWYPTAVALPASAAIALVGAYWVVERTVL